jgi:3-methylcrotonyl-CoA carboxylase alpha subunit
VYSDADANAMHVRGANEAWHLGGSRPAESYLRGDRIIEIALATGAQAIHPGFGFLSENADFAAAVEAAGLRFIGPNAESMRRLGSKAGAKVLMEKAGVPVVPGYTGVEQDPDLLGLEAARIGFPLMIKAAHGGGGKGMRVVHQQAEFLDLLVSCQREAANAFGNDRVLLERYVQTPRHIEFQIFGDSQGGLIHLNERECSVQRRYQKIFEETPSPFVTGDLRERMGEAAVRAGRAIDYVNAGTVEFIVGPAGDFYFMEINTRLQVEHPITEATLGVDLVEWQLRIASGLPLPWTQEQVHAHGHAIEVRLYAEDPQQNFLPSSGRLEILQMPPPGPHVRIDSGVVEGDRVTVFYDPMIAKLIVHDRDRNAALQRMREALAMTQVEGIHSNIEFLETLLSHPRLLTGQFDTGYLDRALDEVLNQVAQTPDEVLIGAAVSLQLAEARRAQSESAASLDPHSPWSLGDGWRLNAPARRVYELRHGGIEHAVQLSGSGATAEVQIGDQVHALRSIQHDGTHLHFLDGQRAQSMRTQVSAASLRVRVHHGNRRYTLEVIDRAAAAATGISTSNEVRAPMPGRVVAQRIAVGDSVIAGQELLVMEAMKMELSLKAPRDGVVLEIRVAIADFVEADAVLLRLE